MTQEIKTHILKLLKELTLCYCPSDKFKCYNCSINNCILYRKDMRKNTTVTQWYFCSDCTIEYLEEYNK